MTRVLLVGKGPPERGGIPSFLAAMMRGDLPRDHELTFLNLSHSGQPQGGRVTVGNFRRTALDASRIWRAASRVDIVHLHSALAPSVTVARAGVLALAGRMRGCRVIVHAHGGNIEAWLDRRSRRLLLRLAMLPASDVVAVWSTGHRVLQAALGRAKVRMIDNGVEQQEPAGSGNGSRSPRILYVGLLTPRKGVVDLLEASRLLRARGVDHELHLVGGTPDEGAHAELPVRAAADEHARFLGSRPPEEMAEAYHSADVFCLPSWWEAMPLSVLEAMACGLPVVATEVGDVARAVDDGVTGTLVPVRSVEALAAALEPLLRDARMREQMGRAGRARVAERFSTAGTARALSAMYAEVSFRKDGWTRSEEAAT